MSVTFYLGTGGDDRDLNVSNANFRAIMRLLDVGLDDPDDDADPLAGSFTGATLDALETSVAFVLDSLAALPMLDDEIAGEETIGTGGARLVACGRRAGYFTDRLTRLRALIARARAAKEPLRYA